MKKLYQTAWWQKLFRKEDKSVKSSSLANVQNIIEFLDDAHHEINLIMPLLKDLEELEKERRVASPELIKVNLQTQGEVLDKILAKYETLLDDTDINGIRLKRIANAFLKKAEEAELTEIVNKKKKDPLWTFGW